IIEIVFLPSPLIKVICTLLVWLHVRAGVSRLVANKTLQGVQLILSMTLTLVEAALLSSGISVHFPSIDLPRDIRAAYQVCSIEPELVRTACCPKCFSLYPQPIPQVCSWKSSPRSRACNTKLWKVRNTRKGLKNVPCTLYTTQSFNSWLHFFLSRQIIEDALRNTFREQTDHPIQFGADMKDIRDSPAWRDLYGSFHSPYHLIFGVYIDWFNPFTNKIAGKHASCGAIILYCLNLPPHLRYKPENTFIAGLTPPPHMPTATTICHLLDPILSSTTEYSTALGKNVPTFYHPDEGVPMQVRVAPLVADLEASRKVAGFLTHAATMFCSFCLLTKTAREALEIASGVRWSPFHHLPYWDPVKHVVLGFMHNWLEGILQHHLRTLWGIGRDENERKKVHELEVDEQWTESDISDSANELDDLAQEIIDNQHQPFPPSSLSPSPNTTSGTSTSSSTTPTPRPSQSAQNSNPYIFNDEDDNNDQDYIPADISPFSFSNSELQSIRDCIRDVSLPTWVQRPPINLGEPGHGKLKAREYLTLFTNIFPLIIPQLWYSPTATNEQHQHFLCFYHLVAATNIVSSFKTSNAAADEYMQHYIQYRTLIQQLFYYVPSKPNHHYAMHNSDLLKYWGPLPSFSEFPGERINGILQRINTNHRLRMFSHFSMTCIFLRLIYIQYRGFRFYNASSNVPTSTLGCNFA
ncbi:hypothetical protein BDN70DRAFT_977179, partial [Pholiota conissans]